MTTDDQPPSNQSEKKSLINRISYFLSGEPQDQEDLLDILQESHEKNLLDSESLSMIKSILQFSKIRVKDIMIPRIQMKVFSREAKLKTIIPLVLKLGHSRFPVIEEDDRSKVVGVLLAKDLLTYTSKGKNQTVKDLMRKVSVIPESKRLNSLLKEFRTKRNHLAIVVDEYGMTAGLVTIEDVLEEIVGEIEDEHDVQEEEYIQKCGNNKYKLNALIPIIEFNERFSANLTDDEHETIGGFIIHQLGFMPKKGDKLEFPPFCFEVLHADERRVYELQIKRIDT